MINSGPLLAEKTDLHLPLRREKTDTELEHQKGQASDSERVYEPAERWTPVALTNALDNWDGEK